MMQSKRKYLYITLVGIVLVSVVGLSMGLLTERWTQANKRDVRIPKLSSSVAPFMHRPYYGSRTIRQRTVSFFDHDDPWYVNDGVFVRYDGAKWQNVTVAACVGGMNCYDGHNGYDLAMWFEPVLSAAPGVVTRAQWYNPLNHDVAYGLWVAIDHGNGLATAYGHLSDVTVSVGDHVGTQWQIGSSGTTGSSLGPHLHIATYYLPKWQPTDPFGWSGRYPDPNVVPDNYLWVSNPGTANTLPNVSSTGRANYPGAIVVDDSGVGWSSTGVWNRAATTSGINSTLHWTTTTPGTATATATWRPSLPADGYYEVGVFVDDTHASSSWAPYTVYSADPNHNGAMIQHTVYADEAHIGTFVGPFGRISTGPQWISIGTYYFRRANGGSVVVSNATGEAGCQVAADGIEFVPLH